MIRILVLESNLKYAEKISVSMKELGYSVQTAVSYDEAVAVLLSGGLSLVIGDKNDQACELCKRLRDSRNDIAFIVLTEETDKPAVRKIYRSGADGYMGLPPETEELQMRVKNLLWRCRIEEDAVLIFGDCRLVTESLTLETPEGNISLRHKEFLLLEKLLAYPGKVFTRARLMDDLWGYDSDSGPRTVDTHIRLLRKKLKNVDSIRIQTVRGLGYRIMAGRKSAD